MKQAIQWVPPEPRKGMAGMLDRFLGPGTTGGEYLIILAPTLLFTIIVPILAVQRGLAWSWWQYAAAALLAFDISGGITTNATSSAKRWYHREGQGMKAHLAFLSVHIVQICASGLLFGESSWNYILITYGLLMAGGLIILMVPIYLQRSTALAFTTLGILLSIYNVIPQISGMEWFAPLIFIKLFASHLPTEAPFSSERHSYQDEDPQ